MSEGVKILRAALRLSRGIPYDVLRKKFKFNARELVQFYNELGDVEKSRLQLERGWRALTTLKKLFTAEPALVEAIFKPFEHMERVVAKKPSSATDDDASKLKE